MSNFFGSSQLHGELTSPRPIPEVWSVQRWTLDAASVQAVEYDCQQEIIEALLATIRNAGYEPHEVEFSGYDTDRPPFDDGKYSERSDGKLTYWVNSADLLGADMEDPFNPLSWAGISSGATICVYDRAKLLETNPNFVKTEDTFEREGVLLAWPEQMGEALILKFHPRYVNENGENFDRKA